MPLPFTHISCGFAPADAAPGAKQPLFGGVVWDEELTSNVTSTNRAPDTGTGQRPVFRVTAEFDRYLIIGANPSDPSTPSRRYLFRAAECTQQDFYAAPGDRIRVVAVP